MAISLTSKLDAINSMLFGIGEAPVNTMNSGLQEAEIAAITLDTVSREVQSAGWAFNTDLRYSLSPNSVDHISVPSNCIHLDTRALTRDYDSDIVMRNQKLYDRTKNTFEFTGAVVVDMIVLLEFEELPEIARRYITLRAGRKFQENILGSGEMTKLQIKDEQLALFALKEAESQLADFNVFDNYDTYRAIDRSTAGSSLLKSQRILYS